MEIARNAQPWSIIGYTFLIGGLACWLGYCAGKDKGIGDGRTEGLDIGRAEGFLEGWITRHRAQEIPEWVTDRDYPDWLYRHAKNLAYIDRSTNGDLYGDDAYKVQQEKMRESLNREMGCSGDALPNS